LSATAIGRVILGHDGENPELREALAEVRRVLSSEGTRCEVTTNRGGQGDVELE